MLPLGPPESPPLVYGEQVELDLVNDKAEVVVPGPPAAEGFFTGEITPFLATALPVTVVDF